MKSIWNLVFGKKDEAPSNRRSLGRFKVRDGGGPVNPLAFLGRMPAAQEGDVLNFPGCWIQPCQISPNSVPLLPGMAVVLDNTSSPSPYVGTGVRGVVAADVGNNYIFGFVVRVYPTQQTTGGMSAALGNSQVPGSVVDILRRGAIGAKVNGTITGMGTQVHIWALASGAGHRQGFCEASATGSSTLDLPLTTGALQAGTSYDGPGDTSGLTQVNFNL
jgi:hypothetical protein